ncbi:GAF and ANTAR domain-containing protein [Kribbella sp. NBC_01245]|uniref:GAF and ANTAR domain-containing protein n=1 Tax=Kribbella sp. NBC_01245 TaxID=2903578 RepID=UPI002E2D30ED|nr:GAF and ANTAR domain-containing protein [Kribbella sp. NBC_01245]
MVEFNPDEPLVARTFAELAVELHDAPSVEETVDAVLQFALRAVSCTYAGLVLAARGGRAEIGAVTDPLIEKLYRFQLDAGDGPLLDSLGEQIIIGVRDTGTDTRWPEWAAKARALGLGSVLHMPLAIGEQTVGVLSLFSTEPNAFGDDDLAIAHILARHASVAVAHARHDESMTQAVDARKLVGQAMGILMIKFDVDGDRAFAILKRYSQDTNTKLRDVAQQVIDTRNLPAH